MSNAKTLPPARMTTCRPDPKPLTAIEASQRIGDATGRQLHEALRGAFTPSNGTDTEPPLAGLHVAPCRLWTPARPAA